MSGMECLCHSNMSTTFDKGFSLYFCGLNSKLSLFNRRPSVTKVPLSTFKSSVSEPLAFKKSPGTPLSLKGKGDSRRRLLKPVLAEFGRYPFDEKKFLRVKLQLILSTSEITPSGTLLLVEEKANFRQDEETQGMLLQVGGDTFLGISYAAAEREPERPMTLHLLFQILEHSKEVNPKQWHLLHIAIVDLRNSTFIGRLFFGNQETGEIVWDCDCRPSDACWLSLKKRCPFFVKTDVWKECAQPLEVLFNADQSRSLIENLRQGETKSQKHKTEDDPMTSIIPSDPVIIKRLKREMSVAISEEDYNTAAKIRDHPYMRKYKTIQDFKKEGRYEEAAEAESSLQKQIQDDDLTM